MTRKTIKGLPSQRLEEMEGSCVHCLGLTCLVSVQAPQLLLWFLLCGSTSGDPGVEVCLLGPAFSGSREVTYLGEMGRMSTSPEGPQLCEGWVFLGPGISKTRLNEGQAWRRKIPRRDDQNDVNAV